VRADDRGVLIGVAVLLAFATVPLLGGRLAALGDLNLRWFPAVVLAFAAQILIVNVFPGGDRSLHEALHIATYVVLGVVLVRNLRVPGLPLIAAGGLSNAVAIAANHGVMPARPSALRTAGMVANPSTYTNSAAVDHPRLWFLGDIAGVPSWVPAANVFSIGDVLMVIGAWVLIHRTCGSRLGRRRLTPPATAPALDH
jgi:hypothetical protein